VTDPKKNRGLVVHHEYPFHGSRNSTVLGTDLSPRAPNGLTLP
jgi:hypothetical protein